MKKTDMNIVSAENGEHYVWGKHCDGWHLVESANLSVIQERLPSGCSEIRHLHEKSEQFFDVLFGVATLEVSDVIHTLKQNQGVHVPPGVPHQLRNESSKDLVFIVISTPPSHGDRIEVEAK